MLNYFNFKKAGDQYLLTNDFGRYLFLDKTDFQALLRKQLPHNSSLYQALKENLFVFDEHPEIFLSCTKELMRDSKPYLFYSTSLHIFVVTNRCNGNCVYCQAQSLAHNYHGDMSFEVAERAVDIALSAPGDSVSFEFQGGEPLLNFQTIRHIIAYSEARRGAKRIQYNIVSNLTLLTDEMLTFFLEHKVSISTSIDGPELLHDGNRPLINGTGCFRQTMEMVRRIRAGGGEVSAIQTTTRNSLACPEAIIDAYFENGFHSVFLRPLTPLGYASSHWREIGYTAEDFVRFYQRAFERILAYGRAGEILAESHAAIFLRKILGGVGENYMELRSPCGAALGQLAYYFNGNIYTCDEGRMLAEMGDDSFLLGSVFEQNYNDLIDHSRCKAVCTASVTEAIPECCDCAYQPYCGVCPVINLAMEHDIFPRSPHGYRCKIYRGMLDTIFALLQENNARDIAVMKQWL